MEKLFTILICAALLAGCSKKSSYQTPTAGAPINISGVWGVKDGTYHEKFYLKEDGCMIRGVATFSDATNYGTYKILGMRTGTTVELYYTIDHVSSESKFYTRHAHTARGVIDGDNISGVWVSTTGIWRTVGEWSAHRESSDIDDMPKTNELVITDIEEPYKPSPEEVEKEKKWKDDMAALQKNLDELKKSNDDYKRAVSNIFKSSKNH